MENKKTFWYHRVTGDGLTVNIYNIHSFCATFDKKDFAPAPPPSPQFGQHLESKDFSA